jgi:hypothetical protein
VHQQAKGDFIPAKAPATKPTGDKPAEKAAEKK